MQIRRGLIVCFIIFWDVTIPFMMFLFANLLLDFFTHGGFIWLFFFPYLFLTAWAIYGYLQRHISQQDEFARFLTAVIETDLPLAPAVRSYALDRPRHSSYSQALGIAACIILPAYTITRAWIGWRSQERLLLNLADRLEGGELLSSALRKESGVCAPEVQLAAAVGEQTGALAKCLRDSDRERWNGAWLEIIPQLLYPIALLNLVILFVGYLMLNIIPKFKKIFDEFGLTFPAITRLLVNVSYIVGDLFSGPIALLLLPLILFSLSVWIVSPLLRWHTPFLGRLYRWGLQATILRTLSRLLLAGQTIPQALEFFRTSQDLPPVARERIGIALNSVQRGEPLDVALVRAGLLSKAMSPLVQSSERARTLPWALGELGDHLAGRAYRIVNRVTSVITPILVVAIGVLVGFVALSVFLPLIKLLEGLSRP